MSTLRDSGEILILRYSLLNITNLFRASINGSSRFMLQAPHLNRAAFKKPCTRVGVEVAQVLRQLAENIGCMRQCPPSQSLMQSVYDAVEELNTAFSLQSKLFHVIQPFYNPAQKHSTPETININVNTSQIEAGPDHQIIHIFKDTEHPYNFGQDKHKSSSELFTPIVKDHFDFPTNVWDIARQSNSISSTSGCLYISEGPYNIVQYAEILPLAAFASLLVEIVARLEHVIEAVQRLGKLAAFQP